ncbi:hypothetical protein, conserved [Eimeria necatrix]|uniref:Uncharacterized protein n=1 Tax=Eimeria necatrix TaxID=51315 RepID=U6MWN5_9EIME|nr:hypothetical protein, conserved [Eimeria necatrix]CDJ68386.1 hypothetical protein, conserved [Eimeria necatrix]
MRHPQRHQQQEREQQNLQQPPERQQVELSQHLETPRRNSMEAPSEVNPPHGETPGGHSDQCQLNAEALALFGPSTRTPSPRRQSANLKSDWRSSPELSGATPSTSSRTRHIVNRIVKATAPQEPNLQTQETGTLVFPTRSSRRYPMVSPCEKVCQEHQQRQQPLQLQREGHPSLEPPAGRDGRNDSVNPTTSVPEIIIFPPDSSVGIPGPVVSEPVERRSLAAQQPQQPCEANCDTAPAQPPGSTDGASAEAPTDVPASHLEGRRKAQCQRASRGISARGRRGRKRRDCCTTREPPGRASLPGDADECSKPTSESAIAALEARFGCGGMPFLGGPTKPLHAAHILELSPLLLAKVLQLLPPGSVAAFGSTCWEARRVLSSYCCITSLSARHVSSLLAQPPAVLKRLLPFLLGLKTLEIELTPAISSPLFLGAAAAAASAAAAAAAGNLLRPTDAVYDQGTISGNNLSEQAHTPRGTRGERRQQQPQQRTSTSSQHHQATQQEGRRGSQSEYPTEIPLEDPSLSRLSWAYGLVQGRALDLLRLQAPLCDAAVAAGDMQKTESSPESLPCPWTTHTAIHASPFISALCHLKSVSAILKLSPTGNPGEIQAATELLLLLQMLLHRNANSLVSIKIAVDLPPSSVCVNIPQYVRALLDAQQYRAAIIKDFSRPMHCAVLNAKYVLWLPHVQKAHKRR